MQTQDLCVIYANEHNIFDPESKTFTFGKNFDEISFAMSIKDAKKTLNSINKEREKKGYPPAYLVEIPRD